MFILLSEVSSTVFLPEFLPLVKFPGSKHYCETFRAGVIDTSSHEVLYDMSGLENRQ